VVDAIRQIGVSEGDDRSIRQGGWAIASRIKAWFDIVKAHARRVGLDAMLFDRLLAAQGRLPHVRRKAAARQSSK
jgi:hypothetical protein